MRRALLVSALLFSPSALGSGPSVLDLRPGASLPRDAALIQDDGRRLQFGELLAGRPIVLSFAYRRCQGLCSLQLDDLARAVGGLSEKLGRDFDVIVISIDPTLQPRRPEGAAGWHLLTGTAGEVRRLADAAGYRYAFDEASKQYRHASVIMTLTPEGKVSRYLPGIGIGAGDLHLALAVATSGPIHPLAASWDRLLLLCFHYDPAVGQYGRAAMTIIRGGSVAAVAAIVWLVARLSRVKA